MANSYVSNTGDGTTTNWAVPFPYLDQSHVKVFVNGVDTAYTWINAGLVSLSPAAAIGAKVVVKRVTPPTALVDFADTSTLLADQLETSSLQAIYSAQEASDRAAQSIAINDASGQFDFGSKRAVNVADPVSAQDAVTKNYVDTAMTSQVVQATTAKVAAQTAQAGAEAAKASADADAVATTTDRTAVAADKATVAADMATTLGYKNAADADAAATAADRSAVHADRVAADSSAAAAAASEASAATHDSSAATHESNAAGYNTSAATHDSNASTSATLSSQWASLTGGLVATLDYSSKEWAVGSASRGVSGKGSAKDWATYLAGTVDDSGYSAKYWAQQAAAAAGGATFFQGTWDASSGSFPSTTARGSYYLVTGAGTVSGVSFDVGDQLFSRVTNPSTTTYTNNWIKVEGSLSGTEVTAALGYTPLNPTRAVNTSGLATGGGDLSADRTINVAKASASDVSTGTDDTKAVTSKALNDAGMGAFSHKLLYVQEAQSSGSGLLGPASAGVWNTRSLNATSLNEISGASLSSSQVTLPAGTYYAEGSAPGHYVNGHKARLRNVTDGTTALVGTSEYSGAIDQPSVATRSTVCGRFTINAQKTFELQHYTQSANTGNGFGVQSNSSEVEIYSELKIWKVL